MTVKTNSMTCFQAIYFLGDSKNNTDFSTLSFLFRAWLVPCLLKKNRWALAGWLGNVAGTNSTSTRYNSGLYMHARML